MKKIVNKCYKAGISVIMITNHNKETSETLAKDCNIL